MEYCSYKTIVKNGSSVVAVSLGCLASSAASASFLPPNKLHLHPSPLEQSNMSQKQFDDIILAIEKVYAPVVAGHKAKLKINRLWKDETVNANASQNGRVWTLNMYGGLARRPEVSPDGFALVVCHELGHHLGGFSFVRDTMMSWASNEGQSDYFAAQACAKEIWKGRTAENATHRATVNPVAKAACEINYAAQEARDLCFRTADASLSLAGLLAVLNKTTPPRFETPSTLEVAATADPHPEAQCRLDTYLAGSICTTAFDKRVIPAKELPNQQDAEAELLAGKYSCLASDGWVSAQRPRCWFKPSLEFDGMIAGKAQWSDASGNGVAEPGEVVSVAVPLENHWRKTNEDVVGEVFSRTNGVSVLKSKVAYRNIPAGGSEFPLSSFDVRISPQFECGHPFELLFRAQSKFGAREFPIKWFVGPKEAAPIIMGGGSQPIVVDDFPSPGISIPFSVKSDVVVKDLELELELDTLYPHEIEFSLVDPSGKMMPIKTGDMFEYGSRDVAKIALDSPRSLNGEWTLRVRDIQENDTATIKSYQLRAPFAEKVECGK
jgi:subtilisin-like proprotein convertase family protein